MPELPSRLSICEPWPLIQQLDYEKSNGRIHERPPADNYKFELKHYNITALADYIEFKTVLALYQILTARSFRVAGLVTDGQHRPYKTGKNFGIITIEDFGGKAEFFCGAKIMYGTIITSKKE